jgi:hypothetical protein
MADREIDEELAMLLHMELAGGAESLAETVADLPRDELERLLCLAVVEVMESREDAERDFARLAQSLEWHRQPGSTS